VARILRFQEARRLIEAQPDLALARVASACGYYDQAHLAREFRALAGVSPRRYAALLMPDGGVAV
jgi:transcriptional regulator GlxA family with amidase domain